MTTVAVDRAAFLERLTELLPPCDWCGDDGAIRMTDHIVLCLADFEYVELHRENGTW